MAATSAAAINIKTSLYFRLIAREEEVNKARGVRGGEAGGGFFQGSVKSTLGFCL